MFVTLTPSCILMIVWESSGFHSNLAYTLPYLCGLEAHGGEHKMSQRTLMRTGMKGLI